MKRIRRLALVIALASAGCANGDNGNEGANANAGSGGTGNTGGAASDAGASGGGGGTAGVSASGSGGGGGSGGTAGVVSGVDGDASIADASIDENDASDSGDGGHLDGGVGPLPDQSCLDDITDYVAAGPFSFEATTIDSVRIWIPDVPAGCKLPVVHFANGTGAHCSTYTRVLEHLASHGFLTACYESTQTGRGTQCIEAVEAVYAQYPALASTQQIGFTGNGTGGGAAYVCAFRAEEKWGNTKLIASHAVPPDTAGVLGGWADIYAQVDSPVFIMNGSVGGVPTDGLVSEAWVREMYEAFNDGVEAYWYEGVEAAHIPVPLTFIEESSIAWFRWKLLGDPAACAYMKAMPDGERWNLQEQQNVVECDAGEF